MPKSKAQRFVVPRYRPELIPRVLVVPRCDLRVGIVRVLFALPLGVVEPVLKGLGPLEASLLRFFGCCFEFDFDGFRFHGWNLHVRALVR